MTAPSFTEHRTALKLLLIVAMIWPSIVTWIYFVALAEHPSSYQQWSAAIGKSVQFSLPILWVVLVCRRRFPIVQPGRFGLVAGLGFGLVVVVAMFGLYVLWLRPTGLFDAAHGRILAKVQQIGISSRASYIAVGLFYAFLHSGLEEYYWRWFVFGHLKQIVSKWTATVLSSLAFAAHHVILLGTFFGYDAPLAYLFSASVGVGGAFWAWLFDRHDRILGSWVSHMIVDAGIFALGYAIVFGGW